MGSAVAALKALEVGHEHEWSCDSDDDAKQTIHANFPPKTWFDNCLSRGEVELPDIDLYISGLAFTDTEEELEGDAAIAFRDRRGGVFFGCCEVIERKRPKAFGLELVKSAIAHNGGQTMLACMGLLRSIGDEAYDLSWRLLDECHHGGVPFSRERVYLVGRRKDAASNQVQFSWPGALPCPQIEHFLDPVRRGEGIMTLLQRVNEMMRLRGMDDKSFVQVISNEELAEQVENAISQSILERILVRLLPAVGLAAATAASAEQPSLQTASKEVKEAPVLPAAGNRKRKKASAKAGEQLVLPTAGKPERKSAPRLKALQQRRALLERQQAKEGAQAKPATVLNKSETQKADRAARRPSRRTKKQSNASGDEVQESSDEIPAHQEHPDEVSARRKRRQERRDARPTPQQSGALHPSALASQAAPEETLGRAKEKKQQGGDGGVSRGPPLVMASEERGRANREEGKCAVRRIRREIAQTQSPALAVSTFFGKNVFQRHWKIHLLEPSASSSQEVGERASSAAEGLCRGHLLTTALQILTAA
ncbi:unnamed protein product [Polarella glacialis]|uniref:Uncharacterized protein n=1 Tax=Polarella glacialis TaxID=89957 RepID=A0A813GLR0_POLGL|nr:unnamed protein product [Polarella glacialis]